MKRIVSSYEQGGGRQADAVARECSVFDFALFGYPTQSGLLCSATDALPQEAWFSHHRLPFYIRKDGTITQHRKLL